MSDIILHKHTGFFGEGCSTVHLDRFYSFKPPGSSLSRKGHLIVQSLHVSYSRNQNEANSHRTFHASRSDSFFKKELRYSRAHHRAQNKTGITTSRISTNPPTQPTNYPYAPVCTHGQIHLPRRTIHRHLLCLGLLGGASFAISALPLV